MNRERLVQQVLQNEDCLEAYNSNKTEIGEIFDPISLYGNIS
jgi:hypothetical protein